MGRIHQRSTRIFRGQDRFGEAPWELLDGQQIVRLLQLSVVTQKLVVRSTKHLKLGERLAGNTLGACELLTSICKFRFDTVRGVGGRHHAFLECNGRPW